VLDVAVVGAGPMGLYIAAQVAKEGYEVAVFEEHSEIGVPTHCSGLFSTRIFDIVGKFAVLHPAKRARIFAPNGSVLHIGDSRIHGYVVDRVEFDRKLASMAIKNGADIFLKERVKKIKYPAIQTWNRAWKAKIIVGADGINSVVRRSLNVKAQKLIGAAQVVAKYDFEDVEGVDIFVGNKIAPGFFGWVIPLEEGLARIGVASYGNSWSNLRVLLNRLNAKPLSIGGGGIPIGTVSRTHFRGIILVGDAAGQVKATSGGGVYPGLRAAQCAVSALKKALEMGDFENLEEYERCWKRTIGKELANALKIHKFYRKLTDEDFNQLILQLSKKDNVDIINRYGDIDYPSRVAWKLFRKNPRLLKYLGVVLRQG